MDDDDLGTLAVVLERAFATLHSELDFCVGLADRAATGRLHEIDVNRAALEMRVWRNDIERAWHELRLLGGDRVARTAALQRLTNGLGDEGSLALIEAVGRRALTSPASRSQLDEAGGTLRRQLGAVPDRDNAGS